MLSLPRGEFTLQLPKAAPKAKAAALRLIQSHPDLPPCRRDFHRQWVVLFSYGRARCSDDRMLELVRQNAAVDRSSPNTAKAALKDLERAGLVKVTWREHAIQTAWGYRRICRVVNPVGALAKLLYGILERAGTIFDALRRRASYYQRQKELAKARDRAWRRRNVPREAAPAHTQSSAKDSALVRTSSPVPLDLYQCSACGKPLTDCWEHPEAAPIAPQ